MVSLALGAPGDLVDRAHAAGCVFVVQVTTVTQAREAAELGVDVIVAQGGEGGGFSGSIGTLALVPQVVDAVAPIPVVAAGGITDGRGLAAAIALGAQGVNIGTRFLASVESRIPKAGSKRSSRPSLRMPSRSSSRSTSFRPSPRAAGPRSRARSEPRSWTSGPRAGTKSRSTRTSSGKSSPRRSPLAVPMRTCRSPANRPVRSRTCSPRPRSCDGSSPRPTKSCG